MADGPAPTRSTPDLSPPDEVAAGLPPVDDAFVLLDFDGTLSALVDDPQDAVAADGALEVVTALARRTRVVLVSGRPVEVLRDRIPGDVGVAYAGGHGAEFADGGEDVEPLVDVEVVRAHRDAAIADLADLLADAEGWYVEHKPTGVAVHSRRAVEPERHLDDVRAVLGRHVGDDDMVVLPSHEVWELRPAGVDKGTATRLVLGDDPRRPVSFGDDVTDEDMFAVAVDRGGTAVLVDVEARETHAAWRVRDPDEVVAVLSAWVASGD